jgi:hypothetical protein
LLWTAVKQAYGGKYRSAGGGHQTMSSQMRHPGSCPIVRCANFIKIVITIFDTIDVLGHNENILHALAAAHFCAVKERRMASISCSVPILIAEDVESLLEAYQDRSKGITGAAPTRRKRTREPLTSVIKLLPEFFPEELYSNSDRK